MKRIKILLSKKHSKLSKIFLNFLKLSKIIFFNSAALVFGDSVDYALYAQLILSIPSVLSALFLGKCFLLKNY